MNMRAKHLVLNDKKATLNDKHEQESGFLISKWRWRPGMKPRTALTIGVLFSVVGLLFVFLGLVSLIAGILDSNSPPLQVPGVVVGYTTNFLDSHESSLLTFLTKS
jgi:hypothetical protein